MNNSISYKKIWRISYPIILGGVAQNIVNVTDTAFLGRLGEVPLAAAGNGGIFYLVLVMTGLGFSSGGEILIGRRNGEKNYPAIGKIFSHLFYCLSAISIVFFLIIIFAIPHFIEVVSKSKDIAENTIEYLDYRAYGIFFSFINFTFRAFYVGITQTRILITNTTLMSLINVVLDYVLIFGEFGFPKMGIGGAALASVISEFVATVHFIYYTTRMNHKKYALFEFPLFDSN
ncbi:MAG: MATE family efflux transporter, partial [Bacteroidetes bacterium]|nr:MATE family efflux transporter [Bacteroidota bacterium]